MQDINKKQETNSKLGFGICLFLVACVLFLAPQAQAQQRFTGIYWIMGNVANPDDVEIDGIPRQVVLYKADPNNGFADDLVGANGLSGTSEKYRINAFEDWRLGIAPGKYNVAIVKSAVDSYGANPVEVDLTGYGWDTAPQLVLMYGAGIEPPSARPEDNLPVFDYIRFGNRLYQPDLVAKGQDFIVSSKPRVAVRIISPVGLQMSSIAMVLNDGQVDAKTFQIKSANVISAAGPSDAPTELSFVYDFASEGQDALPDGTQELTFKAANSYGEAVEVTALTIAGGEPRLIGVPIAYPSPLNLLKDRQVTFQYTLNTDINVEVHLVDVTGRVVKKVVANARAEGGSAGVNKVTWNLITEQGQKVSSGIYIFTIINKDNGKLLGKGKFTAVSQ